MVTNEERLARIEQCKNETEQRMVKLSQRKQQKTQVEQRQYQENLRRVQAKKLREVPTGEYIAKRDPKNKDPDGLGEPLDDHYMPFVSDVNIHPRSRSRISYVCCIMLLIS